MIVCGMEMAASESRLVLLSGKKSDFCHIDVKPRKLKIADDETAENIRAFRDSLFAFLCKNNVVMVAIKKRGKKGEYAGGPVGFKLEAIAQLYEECPVNLIAARTITVNINRHAPQIPDTLLKYQYAAFQTAFTVLP